MNSFKSRFNYLIFKNLVLFLAGVFLIFTRVGAQQLVDTNYASILFDSSKVYYTVGNYSDAIRDLDKVLLLKAKMHGDTKPEYFRVYNLLGIVYKNQSKFIESIDYYKKASESTSDIFSLSVINGNIANIYFLKGDYSKAIFYYENTLLILEKSSDSKRYRHIADNYHNIGFCNYKLENYSLARNYYLKSIQLAEKNKLGGIGETYYNSGLVYQKLDSLEKANYCFKKAIECNTKEFGVNHYMTGMAYLNYANFYSEIGKFSKSEQLYPKAYKIIINTLGHKHLYTSFCLKNNGLLFYRNGKYKQALGYYQKSLISKINNFNDSSVYANPNADVLPDMDLLDVLKLKAQALKKLSESENRDENLKAALATLELTATFTEQLRTGYLYEDSKLQIAAKEHETYLLIVDIANSLYEISGDSKYAGVAFRYAEYSKYAVLRELKNEEMAKGAAGIPDSISDNERRVKQQIASIRMQVADESKLEHPNRPKIDSWNEQLFSLSQNLEGLMQKFESNYPLYYKQKYSNQVVSVEQLQKAMEEKEAILEYVLGDKELYTFTITKDTFLLVKQDADTTFYSKLNFFINALHNDLSSDYVEQGDASYNLYKKLIYPVEPLLKGKNLLIIPDGRLSLIAFDVLTDKPNSNRNGCNYANEPYLIKKYPIGYANSATLYSYSKGDDCKGYTNFLGIAPEFRALRDSLGWLPYGERSVRRLAWLTFGRSLTGRNATEANFRKCCGKYGIIHFYTHGHEDTLNPIAVKLRGKV